MNPPLDPAEPPYVIVETADSVTTLVLNRGERFNPLSWPMLAALEKALDAIGNDAATQVVVLAARGKGFCAGHDLAELRAHADLAWQRELFAACGRLMLKITTLPQPVIARVHGIATAAGCQLVSMCDLAIAADTAKFGLPGVNVGVFCSTPAVGVARNIGRKRAMEMLLTGEMVNAQTALEWGLVNRVVPIAELDMAILSLAQRIKSRSPAVISDGKRTFYQQIEMPIADAYDMAGESMACKLLAPEAAEGIDAFLGKRAPLWRKP